MPSYFSISKYVFSNFKYRSYLSGEEDGRKKLMKKEDENKEFIHSTHVDELSRLRAMNDYLFAEMDSVKKKSQSQQATINWLINEFRKAKEEIELLKSFQQLSIDYENTNKDLDKSNSENGIPQQQKQHLSIHSHHHQPPSNNLYLTNEVFLQDYSIPSSYVPIMNQKYHQTEPDNSLFPQDSLSPDLISSSTYSPSDTDYSPNQNNYNIEKTQQQSEYYSNNPIDFGIYN